MRVLITGANGQLGSELKYLITEKIIDFTPEVSFTYTDIDNLDITNKETLKKYFTENNYDYIVNCAAYTQVDKAETDKESAYLVNAESVKNITETINQNTRLIHVSTDYVFDGKSYVPYTEEMAANPPSVYGKTKLEGEHIALKHENTAVIRTSWLYSTFGKNFVKTIHNLSKERSELKVVFDQIGTPTYARDLANAILTIIKQSSESGQFMPGVYHYSNEGVCSWYDFAKEIIQLNHTNCNIIPIESKDYPTPAVRPFYSVLNKQKIKTNYHIVIPYWRDSLIDFFMVLKD